MTIIKEYRITLPVTVKEYQVGQLFSTAEASKENTGGGEGVEVIKNEPYEDENSKGQYTYKIFRMESKVPNFIRTLIPKGSMTFHEHAWNAYPYCKTVITNPEYMKDAFEAKIETIHLPDLGTTENAHNLDAELLKKRDVVKIDIANDSVSRGDYKQEFDPKIFKSEERPDRTPLGPNWQTELKLKRDGAVQAKELNINTTSAPEMPAHMTCYKLVTIKFKWRGLQGAVEKYAHRQEKRLFNLFHRQVFCWIDRWVNMTMADIRNLEDSTKDQLAKNIDKGEKRGYKAEEK